MYFINRKLWFASYVAIWALVLAAFQTDQPTWVCIVLSVVVLSFIGFTDPAPRNDVETVRRDCACLRCERMRARHNRRRTDLKNIV